MVCLSRLTKGSSSTRLEWRATLPPWAGRPTEWRRPFACLSTQSTPSAHTSRYLQPAKRPTAPSSGPPAADRPLVQLGIGQRPNRARERRTDAGREQSGDPSACQQAPKLGQPPEDKRRRGRYQQQPTRSVRNGLDRAVNESFGPPPSPRTHHRAGGHSMEAQICAFCARPYPMVQIGVSAYMNRHPLVGAGPYELPGGPVRTLVPRIRTTVSPDTVVSRRTGPVRASVTTTSRDRTRSRGTQLVRVSGQATDAWVNPTTSPRRVVRQRSRRSHVPD